MEALPSRSTVSGSSGFSRLLARVLFAALAVGGAGVVAHGLDRIDAAAFVGDAVVPRGDVALAGAAPLALIVGGAFSILPLGSLAARTGLASLVALLAAVWIFWRILALAFVNLRPSSTAWTFERDHLPEPIAASGALGVLCLSPLTLAGTMRPGAAGLTLLVVALGFHLGMRIVRAPQDLRLALCGAFVAGLASGADPIAAVVLWPGGLLLWLWALRRGERWVVLGPLAFSAGLAIWLFAAAVPGGQATLDGASVLVHRLTLGAFRDAFSHASGAHAWAVLAAIVDGIGIVAALLAVTGIVWMGIRQPGAAAAGLLVFWFGLLVAADPTGASGSTAFTSLANGSAVAVLLLTVALPIAAGILRLSAIFGRGRAAAAAALAVIACVAPAFSSVAQWSTGGEGGLPERLLYRAYDQIPPRGTLDPGSVAMSGLMRYGRAIGMRPDVRLGVVQGNGPVRPLRERE